MVLDQCWAKLDPKAEEHLFVGIAEYAKAWKYYNKISKHVQISRNITFDQSNTKLYPTLDVNANDEDMAPPEGEQEPHEHTPIAIPSLSIISSPVPESPAPQIQWSNRVTQRLDYQKLNDGKHAYITQEIIMELENYWVAVSHDDAPIWEEAMKIEMGQHQELRTWEITELPPGWMAIGCWWVYAIKTKSDGEFEKAKARIVAQGFTQRPGMDYYDITSPVVKFDSLHILLAIANTLNWEIEMMDVKGGYLHSMLEEEIYMRQPDRFNDGSGWVLKLWWALYGLKQLGRT